MIIRELQYNGNYHIRSGYFAVTGNGIISAILPSLYDLRKLGLLYSSILRFVDLDFRRHFVLNF